MSAQRDCAATKQAVPKHTLWHASVTKYTNEEFEDGPARQRDMFGTSSPRAVARSI